MAQQRRYAQVAIGVGVAPEVRQNVSDLVRYGLEAVERNVLAERKAGHGRSLHIHHHSLMKAGELAFFRILDDMVGGYQAERNAASFGQGEVGGEILLGEGVDYLIHGVRIPGMDTAGRGSSPSYRDDCVQRAVLSGYSAGLGRSLAPHAAADRDAIYIVHAGSPCRLAFARSGQGQRLPSLHQRLQFAGQGRDNTNPAHAGGAYPCARNQSMAARSAAYTGTTRNPSSRSALAEETNIFFLPMRTASTVARGSRPRSLPVMV